jgi:Tol biopolymer transport system component
MGTKPVRFATATALLFLTACNADQSPTAPSFAQGAASQFSVAPGAVEFSVPPGGSEVVTVTAQYVTTVTSSSSSTACATVSPTSVPTKKPKGSSSYVASFTINAVGVGSCTVTLKDKNGKAATVQVTVSLPLPDRIVYTSQDGDNTDIWVMDLDGQHQTQLTSGPSDLSPVLSSDGRRILFLHTTDENSWFPTIMKVDGSDPVTVPLGSDISAPFFSPNGKQLTFIRYIDGQARIFKADVSGANLVQLATPGANQGFSGTPTWGGSGAGRIVYQVEGPRSIWIMNADGSNQTMVIEHTDILFHSGTFATISPDGTKIAFECSLAIHTFDICVINSDGTGFLPLTDTDGDNRYPRWTRDGHIVFRSTRDGNMEIYIMNVDGTGQTNLTNTTAVNEGTVYPF